MDEVPEEVRRRIGPLACAAGVDCDVAEVRRLLDSGTSARDPVALHVAAEHGTTGCLRLLLERGADPDDATRGPVLHRVLDLCYRRPVLDLLLEHGADAELRFGPLAETPLHVAVRRRRNNAVDVLAEHGVDLDARTKGGKTAYAHAVCRGFTEVAENLARRGADRTLAPAQELCVALVAGDLEGARARLAQDPDLVRSMGPEDARILPDLAGRPGAVPALELLLDAGCPIDARGLDGGTALHNAAWFAAPESARFLIERGAPLDLPCEDHCGTALCWVAHGSRYSGGAEENVESYVAIAEMLCAAGASLADAWDPEGDPHGRRLLQDAVPRVREVLERHGACA